jgi:hypothetical protein
MTSIIDDDSAAGFAPLGVNFNGSTRVHRGAAILSASSSKFLATFWFTHGATVAAEAAFFEAFDPADIFCSLKTDKTIRFRFQSGSSTYEVAYDVTAALDGGWHSIVFSCDLNFVAGSKVQAAALDGVAISPSSVSDFSGAFSVNWNTTDFAVGDFQNGGGGYTGDIAEFYANPGAFLDVTSPTNIAKFFDTGHPVDLGTDGSFPTGSQPRVYLSVRSSGAVADFLANRGAAGNFSVGAGTLSLSGTNP